MTDNTLFEKHTDVFDGNLEMYYCGKRIKSKNHVYGPEIRSHFLIVLVEKGTAIFYRNEKETVFKDNDMLVMFPGERIFYRAQSEWSIKWIGVKGDKVEELFGSIGVTREKPIFTPANYKKLSEIIMEIYDMEHDCSMYSKCKAQSLLYGFFSELLCTEQNSERIDYAASAIRIMKYNYNNDLSIDDISEQLFVNHSYFSRVFKSKTGMSPKQYILNLRMDRAKELLKNTDYSVSEISASVGFKDALYFSRIFSKKEGISPSLYRKSCK